MLNCWIALEYHNFWLFQTVLLRLVLLIGILIFIMYSWKETAGWQASQKDLSHCKCQRRDWWSETHVLSSVVTSLQHGPEGLLPSVMLFCVHLSYCSRIVFVDNRIWQKWWLVISKARSKKTLWLLPCALGSLRLLEASCHVIRFPSSPMERPRWQGAEMSSQCEWNRSSSPSQTFRWW